jgi:hypothetical protein
MVHSPRLLNILTTLPDPTEVSFNFLAANLQVVPTIAFRRNIYRMGV